MLKNLPEGSSRIVVEDIEKNVGISRQFSIFELTKGALRAQRAKGAVPCRADRIVSEVPDAGRGERAVHPLLPHSQVSGASPQGPNPSPQAKAEVLGVNPYFFREYDLAVRNYPLEKCMGVISLLNDYDYKGKGGDVGPYTKPESIFIELITKILNI